MKFLPTEEYYITICRFSTRELNPRTTLRRIEPLRKTYFVGKAKRNRGTKEASISSTGFNWFAHKGTIQSLHREQESWDAIKTSSNFVCCFIHWISTTAAKVLPYITVTLWPCWWAQLCEEVRIKPEILASWVWGLSLKKDKNHRQLPQTWLNYMQCYFDRDPFHKDHLLSSLSGLLGFQLVQLKTERRLLSIRRSLLEYI